MLSLRSLALVLFQWGHSIRSRHSRIGQLSAAGDGGWASKFDQKLQGWFIHPDDIQVCRKEDGTEWLLVR
jgi:hypothetical protein